MRITIRLSTLLILFVGVAHAAPIPKLTARDFGANFVPASLSNGFIGIRPGVNPLIAINSQEPPWVGKQPGGRPLATVVQGFLRNKPYYSVETWAPAPYPLAVDLVLNHTTTMGLSGSPGAPPGAVQVQSQTLDMANGELETVMTYTVGGVKLDVRVVQFASRSVPSLLCQRILLTPSADSHLEADTRIDTANIPGAVYRDHAAFRAPQEEAATDRVMGFRNDRNKLGIALAVPLHPGVERLATGSYAIEAKAGQTYTFDVLAAMVAEPYHPDPDLEAIRLARWGRLLGFDELREQNRKIWAELWKSRIEIDGDDAGQRALDTAFFYLMANSHPDSRLAVPPYGFSQYDVNFQGHILWDMDSFMFPPALLLWPQTAKGMVEFRARTLDAARNKAARFGYQGAQYPWEAATDGSDACYPVYEVCSAEVHIVPDVAIEMWEYQVATQDADFLRTGTWPVLHAIAEWIASRGYFTPRGYEIDHVEGPDENTPNVNDGTYTNLACKLAMRDAMECARLVGITPPAVWQRIEREIIIPTNPQKNIVIPYDGAIPGNHYSAGSLQFIFLHGLPVSLDLFRNTYEFEEKLQQESSIRSNNGANLCSDRSAAFSCTVAVAAAAFFGDRHKAAELFRQSWQPYWVEPFGLTRENPVYVDGSYITNYGALLMDALMGFTGLRITDGDWAQYPAVLPEGWNRITLDRIWIRGKPMRVVAENGHRAVITEIKE